MGSSFGGGVYSGEVYCISGRKSNNFWLFVLNYLDPSVIVLKNRGLLNILLIFFTCYLAVNSVKGSKYMCNNYYLNESRLSGFPTTHNSRSLSYHLIFNH